MRKAWFCMLLIALVALVGATSSTASPGNPANDFCGGGSVVTKFDVTTDPVSGVTYASSIFVPASVGYATVGVYFNNDGPGPVTFAVDWDSLTSAWSTLAGGPLPYGTFTPVSATPTGSVLFSDGGWAGEFAVGDDFIGCTAFQIPEGTSKANVQLRLSFFRDGVRYSVPVNVHFR